MSGRLKIPPNLSVTIDAHRTWVQILKDAQALLEEDVDLQDKAAKGLRLKERRFPPEVLGRTYGQYCSLINKMYDAYLNSVQLQRAPYILEIINIFMKRLYELRNELVHLIINDYFYIDSALIQMRMTPFDIEIVIPYHFPLECRPETLEQTLQKMWSDAIKRKNTPVKTQLETKDDTDEAERPETYNAVETPSNEEETIKSQHTSVIIIPEKYVQAIIIQKHERFRQYFREDCTAKCTTRRMYFAEKVEDAPLEIKFLAAKLIQMIYRKYMEIKRQRDFSSKRDVMLGLISDPFKKSLKLEDENNKNYVRRREKRMELREQYMKELEKENVRLLLFKKNNQIDDITDHVKTWFKEWYYGYGFFPEYPYDVEGGTLMAVRGDYPTIEEKIMEDEKNAAATKGKTKEQLKQEKVQAKADAAMKAQLEKEQQKKDAEQLFKMQCNPFTDPGYKAQTSEVTGGIIEALQKYRASWSIYDNVPPEKCDENIYGFLKPLITEDLMCQLHKDCRKYVDELMRLDLSLLIKMHQIMYKNVGWKYPKMKPRKRPKPLSIPKPMNIDSNLLKGLEPIFDLGLISKPTSKIKDILGDSNNAAYDLNLQDPDAKFPPPGYGDVRQRLVLSCVLGSGMQPGAKRNKSVMLLGPERNGKSFLVDCVAGEINAIKIDITPEVFSALVDKPGKVLTQVFLAARAFQPAVIYMRNIERVFCKKIPPQDKWLKAKTLKSTIPKLLKSMANEDKIIFIATCTYPLLAQTKPLVALFNEVILVPRTDYATLQLFFHEKFQTIRSMPRDYCVQPLAQLLQGYGFGFIIELFNQVMTPERIVRLNITPLSASEFIDPLLEKDIKPVTMGDYQTYIDYFITNSPLAAGRAEFEVINICREIAYRKLGKKKSDHK